MLSYTELDMVRLENTGETWQGAVIHLQLTQPNSMAAIYEQRKSELHRQHQPEQSNALEEKKPEMGLHPKEVSPISLQATSGFPGSE